MQSNRWWRSRGVAAAILALILYLSPGPAHAQARKAGQAAAASETLQPVERFSGSAKLKAKDGSTKEARAVIRRWSILGRQKIEAFPESGFLLVALRAGKVTTTIGGKEENHSTGDFWTVDAGKKMSVEVKGESAVLEVVSLAVR